MNLTAAHPVRALSVIRQNITFALGLNALFVILTCVGYLFM